MREEIEPMSDIELIRNDLAQSAAALRTQPLLLIITLGLGLAPVLLVGPLGILNLPVVIFEAGFVGTQRIWFLRAVRGKQLRNDEIWPLTRAFIGRMVVLGLVTGILASVVILPVLLLNAARLYQGGETLPTFPPSFLLAAVIVTLVVDVALTFVVPALSFTTKSVREAFRIGFRMIGETWPGSALYVLTPGILASSLGVALPPSVMGRGGLLVVGALGAVLGLLFKGAIAALYLRLRPETGDDGSAYSGPGGEAPQAGL
jgi:hypothetical protein